MKENTEQKTFKNMTFFFLRKKTFDHEMKLFQEHLFKLIQWDSAKSQKVKIIKFFKNYILRKK